MGSPRSSKRVTPTPTQFDEHDHYYDETSDPADPRWYVVDIAYVAAMKQPLTRDMLKANDKLDGMMLLQRGSRLSVQPVTKDEWLEVLKMGGQKESW